MRRIKFFDKIAAGFLSVTLLFAVANPTQAAEKSSSDKKIIINIASRALAFYDGGERKGLYPLGLGKVSTPTPTGYYKIQTKEVNPTWIDPANPEYEIPSGANNPLGYRWMRIWGNYGIHGTNKPDSIGHYASNGCIRMREEDVEKLFDEVEIGTPVEITYNRVVVEKIPDDNVVYYIYPDGYKMQKLNVAAVRKWLAPFGVSNFESDANILQKIKDSDGKPTYIGKIYSVEVDGKKIEPVESEGRKFVAKAVIREGITYLPAVPIALALQSRIEWRPNESTLKTYHGEVTAYERGDQLYCNADDAIILFNIDGGLQNLTANPADGKIFRFTTVPDVIEEPSESEILEEKIEQN